LLSTSTVTRFTFTDVASNITGSGKSTFASSLERSGWKVISSDALRSKKGEFDNMVGYWTRPVSLVKTRVVIDKCLVSAEERRALQQLMHVPDPSDVCAVYFDKSVEDCRVNVCSRVNHPSIPGGDGVHAKRIVEGFSKKLEAPTADEGFGRIEIIQSHDQSDELVRLLGAEPTMSSDFLFKFPRTQHLAAGENYSKIKY